MHFVHQAVTAGNNKMNAITNIGMATATTNSQPNASNDDNNINKMNMKLLSCKFVVQSVAIRMGVCAIEFLCSVKFCYCVTCIVYIFHTMYRYVSVIFDCSRYLHVLRIFYNGQTVYLNKQSASQKS